MFDEHVADGDKYGPAVDMETLGAVVEWVYLGRVDVHPESVLRLAQTAGFLGLEPLREACAQQALSRLCVENAALMLAEASGRGVEAARDEALTFMLGEVRPRSPLVCAAQPVWAVVGVPTVLASCLP